MFTNSLTRRLICDPALESIFHKVKFEPTRTLHIFNKRKLNCLLTLLQTNYNEALTLAHLYRALEPTTKRFNLAVDLDHLAEILCSLKPRQPKSARRNFMSTSPNHRRSYITKHAGAPAFT